MEFFYGSPQYEEITVTSLDFLRERIFDEHADYSTAGQGAAVLGRKSYDARSPGDRDHSQRGVLQWFFQAPHGFCIVYCVGDAPPRLWAPYAGQDLEPVIEHPLFGGEQTVTMPL